MTEPNLLTQVLADAYDETPYTSNAFPMTAPGHLRAVAYLYGLDAPPLEHARVLELGCAAGGNLLPFAAAHPNAEIVGIDLSPQQITAGRAIVEKLGLQNIDLRAMSITDIDSSLGHFDYIICHGVFSWVPPEVRQAIMRVCHDNLSPEGIAYISYNTYPGWKASDVVRDAMILNSFGASSPQDRLSRAKDMLGLLENGLSTGNPLRAALQGAARALRQQSDYYLMHEHLEAVNSPCYFLEFAAAAQEMNLAYLTEADPESTFASNFGANVALLHNALAANASREMREQYLDFSIGRQFRKSLLVHANRKPTILERPEANGFAKMHFSAYFTPIETPATAPAAEKHYRTFNGGNYATKDSVLIAIIDALRQTWPNTLSFSELIERSQMKAPGMPDADFEEVVLALLVNLLNTKSLHYRLDTVGYQQQSGKPKLIPGALSLWKARDLQALQVGSYNLWHQSINVPTDELSKFIIPHIDGNNSVQELRTLLRDSLASGELAHPNGKSLKGHRNLDSVAQELTMNMLSTLRRCGLIL